MATMKNITIDVTYAELTALIANSGLFQGVNYLITDRGDRGLLFKAASRTQLEIQGTRYMLCPATYAAGPDAYGNNWLGIWNSTKTAAVNDLSIWNGQVWKCIGEVSEPLDAPNVNPTNWELIPKPSFTNHEYIEMIFTVSYDVENDWISKQSDENGNQFGIDFFTEVNIIGNGYNICDYSDWNLSSKNVVFRNNKCQGVINSDCSVFDNYVLGVIENNIMDSISNNIICGSIKDNNLNDYGAIFNNVITKNIYGNLSTVDVEICFNFRNGDITGNWNTSPISSIDESITGTDF